LVPPSAEPKNCEVKQNRQCGARFDNKATESVAYSLGSEARENLMRSVKNGRSDRIPEPARHKEED